MKNYIAINASAGSGKTYTLVQRLLMLCLRYPNQPDAIRNILALTFTNKAANEMKKRILDKLKSFSSDDYQNLKELQEIQNLLAGQKINVSIGELHQRSKKVLDYILHHYSMLNIGTIDKFNSRLVRSFSHELGLAQNFNLEIQAEPFLIEAVDKLLNEIGENEEISEAFMDFVNYNLDNNERVNLNKTMYETAKEYIKDIHYEPLKSNENFSWEAYKTTKSRLREEIKKLKTESEKLTDTVLELLREKDLDASDFSGGTKSSIALFFKKAKDYHEGLRDFPFPANEESAQATFLKGASSKAKSKQFAIDEILDYLLETRERIIANQVLMLKKQKILRALLPLRVNKDIQEKLKEIEQENDLVLLPKFNVLINENLKNEPSMFIYEKVGTKYDHYFFDEFQDTSAMQWQNFLPLRDDSISTESKSFTIVGDPKQSIYRFRGGDSGLMLNIISGKEGKQAFVENLSSNWRSARNIVDFNNKLYRHLSEEIGESHREIFGNGSQQAAQTNFEGRVKVSFLENQVKADFYQNSAERMCRDIQECLDNGFKFSDITILCRGNTDIFNYSKLLGGMKVVENGRETYIKTISEKGLTLELSETIAAVINFFSWEASPKNHRFVVLMMYHLNRVARISMKDFTAEMLDLLALEEKSRIEKAIEEKYGVKLRQTDIPPLNLYNLAEYYVREFSVAEKETDFLLNFLELLYNFSQNKNTSIKDFLRFWEEEGKKTSIQASENVDAIHIMTIHKSKGLEFPVVLLPMENSHNDATFQSWLNLENEDLLKAVNISGYDKTLASYDVSIRKFNEGNEYLNKIDRICLQYVATTRPVEQLFFYIEKPSKTGVRLELFDFLDSMRNIDISKADEENDTFDLYPTSAEILKKRQNRNTEQPATLPIMQLTVKPGKPSNLRIATPSKNYRERNRKVKTGILTHEILSKIKSKNDVEKTLKVYELDGTMTHEETKEIEQAVFEIIEKYPMYFPEDQNIINEKDIMISQDGSATVYRPDRLIQAGDGWIIVDFKTGVPKASHRGQIENYISVLERTGRKVVKADLVYL